MSESAGEEFELFWDATYAIVVTLLEAYPGLEPEQVGLNELAELVTALPTFVDDPDMATERLLQDILITWFEEAHSR
jgi:FeS assembly protein IscX